MADKGVSGKIRLFYKLLYNFFGPQYWWPADTPFETAVGAVLTQNTSWNNAEKAIVCLKQEKVMGFRKMYALKLKELAMLIRPAGYFNVKAKRLKNFLDFIQLNCKGRFSCLTKEKTEFLRNRLLEVNGLGPETVDSILLYALGRPVFVVDAYTKRIFSRHRLCSGRISYQDLQSTITDALRACRGKHWPPRTKLFNEYHALLVRLGKEFCLKKRPLCHDCPLYFF